MAQRHWWFGSFISFLILTQVAFSDQPVSSPTPLEFREEDGSPSVFPYRTRVPNTTLTDNADGTISLVYAGAPSGGVFTAGSVPFGDGDASLAQDNANLFWDDTNNRLGIGTASPSERLDVSGNVRISGSANSLISEPATGVTGTMGFSNVTTALHGSYVEIQYRPTTATKGSTLSVRPNGSPGDGPSAIAMYITDAVTINYGYLSFGFERVTSPNFAMIVSRGIGTVATRPIAIGFEDGSATFTEAMRISVNTNVGIGTTANASALLDVSSTTKGFLPPRMTTVQRDNIGTPPAGLMIYNSTTNKLNFFNGTAWEAVTSA